MILHFIDENREPAEIRVGDIVIVSSSKEKGWLAKLGGYDPIYTVQREFLKPQPSNLKMQTRFVFQITEAGQYEVYGLNEKEFRYKFKVD